MATSSNRWLDEIGALFRAGRFDEARTQFLKGKSVRILESQRVEYANLARRLNLPFHALRKLGPVVRPSGRKKLQATDTEVAEYAASLIKIGAALEGRRLLEPLNWRQHPQILLFRVFSLFSEWEYSKSLPLLFQYLSHGALSPYERALGATNLVAALVHERDKQAKVTLAEVLAITKKEGFRLLYGNALIFEAEHSIYEGQWEQAERSLKEADGVFENSANVEMLESFFVRKWRAIGTLYRKGAKGVLGVEKIKQEALARKHAETSRDCDFHLATVLQDKSRFLHLYFGTPFEQYKKHLLLRFEKRVDIPQSYDWNLSRDKRKAPMIDLFERDKIKPGQVLHRFLSVLTSDFYRPLRAAVIHAQVYPDDFFNPLTSPHRVSQVIRRLRSWLHANRCSVGIREDHGSYQIEAISPCLLKVHRDLKPNRSEEHLLCRLSELSERETFTVHDVCDRLAVPIWTARRLLRYAQENHSINALGQGHSRRYRLLRT